MALGSRARGGRRDGTRRGGHRVGGDAPSRPRGRPEGDDTEGGPCGAGATQEVLRAHRVRGSRSGGKSGGSEAGEVEAGGGSTVRWTL